MLSSFTTRQNLPALKIKKIKLPTNEKDDKMFTKWGTDAAGNTYYREVQSGSDGKRFSTLSFVLGADPAKTGEQYASKEKINSNKLSCTLYDCLVSLQVCNFKKDQINVVRLQKTFLQSKVSK